MQNMKRGSFLRKSIMAPEGFVLVVGDLGQIEPRMLAWLSGYVALLDIFRAGGDPYATFAAQMFGIPGLTKESHPLLRQSGKSAMLGAGYQLGWASFAGQLLTGFLGAPPVRYTKIEAKLLGVTGADIQRFATWLDNVEAMALIPHVCSEEELLIHCVAAKAIIDKYRTAADPVVSFWELLGNLLETCIYGGSEYEHKGVLQFRKNEIELVNGMRLRYPDTQVGKDAKGRVQYTYADGERRVKLYPGKVCISGSALVLTGRGWVPLQYVRQKDYVHDGVELVRHAGLIDNGVQACVTVDGVAMTPDHKVLTHDGWQTASSFPRPVRPDVRGAYSDAPGAQSERELVLALHLRVWEAVRETWRGRDQGSEAGQKTELRVSDAAAYRSGEPNARDDAAPRVHLLAQYAQSVYKAVGAGIQELRCAGHTCVQSVVALFRDVLGGYGVSVSAGADVGASRQRRKLHAEELLLGNADSTSAQHTQHDTERGCAGTGAANRTWPVDNLLSHKAWLARIGACTGRGAQQPGAHSVYDIADCGPRNRFVVLGVAGPMIVHNCNNVTQALARIVMTGGMLRIDKVYSAKLTVHDEGGYLVPERDAEQGKTFVHAEMVRPPKWAPDLPLTADVGFGKRYGDIK